MMDNYFKPVHSPSGPGEIKPRKHHHQHHHHQLHHDQDPQSQRYTMLDVTDRIADDSHGHHLRHQRGHYIHDDPHRHQQSQQFHHSEEDEILYNSETPVTLSRASSSSLSSTDSSSSFSSWYTEESANDPFTLRHAEQPQHSLSCSNIADVRRGFREDNGSEPIVFATVQHGKKGSVCSETHVSSHKREKGGFSSLDRSHSRSAGLLRGIDSDVGEEQSRISHMNYSTLYKSSSLNRSLAFSEDDILLGVSLGPKRAVSSSQLPSKGILKNKEPLTDIRKVKSMEVLSPRVSKGQDPSGQKGKGITQVEMEQARANFVQGKLQFSAFLDEITKQVISPSDLTILGLNKNKPTGKQPAPAQTPGPVKPQLPPKKHRESSEEERTQRPRQQDRQEEAACSRSRKPSNCTNPDKLTSFSSKKYHGSPPPNHFLHKTHGNSHKDRRPSPTGGSLSGDRYGRSGQYLTDGTNTSPEPVQPKQRHHHKQQPTASLGEHTQHYSQHQTQPGNGHKGHGCSPPSSAKGVEPGLGSESSSTKSDSSRARDTATSHSSEQSGRHHSQHEGLSKQYRVSSLF
ncbi:protein AF-9 [Labrus mixtus]|uniref:protein AF-9 n=1 Tax=Labrus mixtus TaxID=508554 RepID=UPI0029C0B2AC|nr:protein AF-9 [Labrus mixtus]